NQSLDVFLAQLNSDGSLDENFGNSGIVLFSSVDDTRAFDVDLRSDGKIVLSGDLNNAGNKDFFIMLLNADGTVVNSFGDQGILKIDFSMYSDSFMALELDKNDGMYIAGRSFDGSKFHASIAKVSALGLFDINFAPSGKLMFQESSYSTAITNIKLDGNGNLVGVGYVVGGISEDLYIFRILPTGKFDLSFDTDGKRQFGVKIGNAPDERFTALDIQADGKILATATYNDGGVKSSLYIRFRTDGKTDGGFGGPLGYVLIPETTWDAWIGFIHVVSNERALLAGRIYTSEYNTMVSAIYLTEPFPTSVQNQATQTLGIFPNPATNQFSLEVPEENGTVSLYALNGQMIQSWNLQAGGTYELPSMMNPGVYLIRVLTSEGVRSAKLQIQ
ncbi:MAG: T9SS type A sorting domain-containing protein, partial [Bacteroidota bacterium]|nr:T9SS type A sorting domain-containing protein [Bacteroidota bacterium]MDX5431926.1 T9SS type A sorting domain-containing protein [Bacteroidota bacterium]MDX5470644.1 T9SS type A sorting domain-containing protein [Bacteroidota bacterium]